MTMTRIVKCLAVGIIFAGLAATQSQAYADSRSDASRSRINGPPPSSKGATVRWADRTVHAPGLARNPDRNHLRPNGHGAVIRCGINYLPHSP